MCAPAGPPPSTELPHCHSLLAALLRYGTTHCAPSIVSGGSSAHGPCPQGGDDAAGCERRRGGARTRGPLRVRDGHGRRSRGSLQPMAVAQPAQALQLQPTSTAAPSKPSAPPEPPTSTCAPAAAAPAAAAAIAAAGAAPAPAPPREGVLGDNCRFVFLDVGANRGITARKLFEPNLFPGAPWVSSFEQHFGSVDVVREQACSFSFEPNPKWAQELSAIADAYRKRGWKHTNVLAAAWNRDETLKFFRTANDPLETGARLSQGVAGEVEVSVAALDLAAWMRRHILPRTWPPAWGAAGKVLMKMDVEGAEWTLLCCRRSWRAGLCAAAWISWPLSGTEAHTRRTDRGPSSAGARATWEFLMSADSSCQCKIVDLDDETGAASAFPLP